VIATKPNPTGNTLESVIPALAGEFEATKVHIVAHSKGGLWSPYFLKYGPVSTNCRDKVPRINTAEGRK